MSSKMRSAREQLIGLAVMLAVVSSASSYAADTPAASGTAAAPAAAAPATGNAAQPKPKSLRDYGTVPTGPIEESTTVSGKPEPNLNGVWLLVAQAELVPGKFRNFPQIFKITQDKGGMKVQLLDLKLPEDVEQAIKDANRQVLAWTPSPEILQKLKQSWSTLPTIKEKYVDEFLYGKIKYGVVASDQYGTVFAAAGDDMKKVIDGSKVALRVDEEYKPRDLGPDSRIAQMISRSTVYGLKSVDPNVIKGTCTMSLIAVGASSPIPYAFNGPFTMYRLSS